VAVLRSPLTTAIPLSLLGPRPRAATRPAATAHMTWRAPHGDALATQWHNRELEYAYSPSSPQVKGTGEIIFILNPFSKHRLVI
jgi:hypothetical protein